MNHRLRSDIIRSSEKEAISPTNQTQSGDSEQVVGRNFLALGGGEALARVIAFGATAYLTRALGADGFGVVAFASAITLYLVQISNFGIDTLGIREIAEDQNKMHRLVPAVLTIRLAYTMLLTVVVALLAIAFVPEPDGPVIAAFAMTLLPQAVTTRWAWLGLESAMPVGISRIAGESAMAILVLVLVRNSADLWAVPAAQIAGDFISAVILLVLLRRRGFAMPMLWSWVEVRPLFARAWPIVGHSLLGLLIYNSDLIFLRFFRTSEEVGLYAAAYVVISFLINLGVAYGTSLLPTLTRLGRGTDEERTLYHSAYAQVFAASLPLALGGSMLAAPLLAQVFGEDYASAGSPLGILIWSVPFSLFRNVAIAGLIARDRQDQMLKTTVWSALLNAGLNVLLIPRLGMVGAACATLSTEILRTLLAVVYAMQEKLQFTPPLRHWRAIVGGAAMVAVLQVWRMYGSWDGFWIWPAIALGAATYAVTLMAVGGIRFSGRRPRLSV